MNHAELKRAAIDAATRSYAPYSNFHVGAALLCSDGTVFQGANVENRSYGLTICAERSAIASAVSAGQRAFTAIAVYSPDSPRPLPPCGACRQVISEFLAADALILFADQNGTWEEHTVDSVLPFDSLHELRER